MTVITSLERDQPRNLLFPRIIRPNSHGALVDVLTGFHSMCDSYNEGLPFDARDERVTTFVRKVEGVSFVCFCFEHCNSWKRLNG